MAHYKNLKAKKNGKGTVFFSQGYLQELYVRLHFFFPKETLHKTVLH